MSLKSPPLIRSAIDSIREELSGVGAVFYVSISLVAVFAALGIFATRELDSSARTIQDWVTANFGWMYLVVTTSFVLFALFLAISRFGRIRLGADDETPEFSFPSWLAMIFSGGMGVGLVFWGVAEPMTHFNEPPLGLVAAHTQEAARLGLRYAFFHWGFHQWANFAILGLAIAYVRFRHQSHGLISETLRPLWGSRVDGALGNAVDVLTVLSTTFGVATTLGLGALQINSGLARLFNVPYDVSVQLMILAMIAVMFTASALTALDQGIRYLSNLNMLLAATLLLFVLIVGPTSFIASMMTNTVGEYLDHFVGMSFFTAPFSNEHWVERWTMFYWAWGLSWAPFVGTFIARISRGRTIREFVLGVIFVPVLLSVLWFSTFGGTAIYYELQGSPGIATAVSEEMSSAIFAMFTAMGAGSWLSILAVVLVVTFVVTSADSATFVLGMFTSKGVLNPTRLVRVLWGGLQLLVAGVLLLGGGLLTLQTVSIVAAFPFMLLMVLMAYSLFKDLKAEVDQFDAQERLLLSRLEAFMLNEEEREAARVAAEEAHPTAEEEPPSIAEEEAPSESSEARDSE
ncbi:MAG: BCCT family transporter [Chrysiogenetes bacterium]|nr:BCCT family transporter [Chrysiogenetes bacterium]